jgi:hypothetical protein
LSSDVKVKALKCKLFHGEYVADVPLWRAKHMRAGAEVGPAVVQNGAATKDNKGIQATIYIPDGNDFVGGDNFVDITANSTIDTGKFPSDLAKSAQKQKVSFSDAEAAYLSGTTAPAPAAQDTSKPEEPKPEAPKPEAPPKEEPAAAQSSSLATFLAKFADLYYDKLDNALTSKYKNANELRSAILDKGGSWGPASRAALAAFCQKLSEGSGTFPFNEGAKISISTEIEKVKGSAADTSFLPENYEGSSFPYVKFNRGEIGLYAFLAFAYVAMLPGGEASGVEAAARVGIEPEYDPDNLVPKNVIWRALCLLGSIVPFPFMLVVPPGDEKIPSGSVLEIEGSSQTVKFQFAKDTGRTALLLGTEKGQKIDIPGYGTWSTSLTTNNSKNLISMIGSPVTAKLRTAAGDFKLEGVNVEMGVEFDFRSASAGPRTLPMSAGDVSANAKRLSGESSMQQQARPSTRENPSWGGERGPFKLQNVYLNAIGNPELNAVDVMLYKRIVKDRDVFELRVQRPTTESILIPIRLSADAVAMAEVPSITALAILGPPALPAGQEAITAFYPVSSLEWHFEGRQVKYGDTAPAIGLVDFETSSQDAIRAMIEKGINVRVDIDPAVVQEAIRQYVASDNNPVKTALYKSSSLIYAMNNIPRPR